MLKKSWTVGTLNVTDVPELNICKWLQWWILCSFSDQNLLHSKPKTVLEKQKTIPFNPRWLLSKGKMGWRNCSPVESACCSCWIPKLVPSTHTRQLTSTCSRDPTPSSGLCKCPCTHTQRWTQICFRKCIHTSDSTEAALCNFLCRSVLISRPQRTLSFKRCVTTSGRNMKQGLVGRLPGWTRPVDCFFAPCARLQRSGAHQGLWVPPARPGSVFLPEIFSRPEQGLGSLQTPFSFRKYQNYISSSHIL